jgi:uncharacterized radical SAM superfamily Fe-S cluster-containing enzyme
MKLRDHTFLGMTQSLCPDCLALVPAKIIARGQRVYFRKRCPAHGVREDFVCSDVRWFDRMEYSLPGKLPKFGVEPERGCPYDCGLCTEHEQHTCIGVLEITDACNLTCPMCYAASAPGRKHRTVEECRRAIDALVEAEGRPEVLQLSGGEPTIHPQFLDLLDYACRQPIDVVMINTNGIRLARDKEFLEQVADYRHRIEVYMQLDSLDDEAHLKLRGESLLETKMKAIEALGEAGIRVILVCTLQAGVNEEQIGPLVDFGIKRPWITGLSFQPACYVGRHVLPEELEQRITFPDVIRGVAQQTGGRWRESDFMPLPCAHPNAHSLAYAYRSGAEYLPLARFIDAEKHLDLLAGGITFDRPRARALIEEFLSRQCCSGGDCGPPSDAKVFASELPVLGSDRGGGGGSGDDARASGIDGENGKLAEEFFSRALAEELTPADVFRITTTTFMDAYNFDVRQLMKSCVHHVLPTGHLIPFSAYNVLYRDGHVPLPALGKVRSIPAAAAERVLT